MTGGMCRQVRRAESRTPPVEVEVIEPPMEGRPEGYVPGTIGPVQLEASVDRTDCPVGETATITVRAKSVGSLSSAQLLFERNVDGARVRAAEGRTTVTPSTEGRYESVRTMELLIVAERPGTVALGEARLPYWDPSTQRYDVARVLLPTVRGTGEAIARGAQATEQPDPTRELRALSERPKLRAYAPWFSRGSRALGVAILPSVAAAIVAGASAALRYKRRVDDERASESKNDPSSLLRRAQRLLAEDEREACALASRALERAKSLAREAEVELSSEARARVREAEKVLEAVRFAGEGSAREALSRTEDAVRSVLEALR
jgi:hypothetical protein